MKPINELSGRELDAACAVEVMEWRWINDAAMYGAHTQILLRPEVWKPMSAEYLYATRSDREGCLPNRLPKYSSSWDAAREVVEKVSAIEDARHKPAFEMHGDLGLFTVVFGDALGGQSQKSLPEAICRAALAWARRGR